MAAANTIIKNGGSLEFYTGVPVNGESIESPLFCVMGDDWKFRFTTASPPSYYYYEAYIKRKNARTKFRSFKFDYHVYLNDETNSYLGTGLTTVVINKNGECRFWEILRSQFRLPEGYRTGNIVKFSFCFYLPDKPLLLFKQKSRDAFADTNLHSNSSMKNISIDFSELFDSSLYHDVVIKCGEHTIKAHKVILSARSEVFKVMLQSDMQEGRSSTVNIKDISATNIRDFIKYLYTDSLPQLTFEKAKALYEIGDKYDVRSLLIRCSEYLQNNLSQENVCQCFALADLHQDKNLKDKAVTYMLEEKVFLRDEYWSPFCEKYPKIALEIYKKSHERIFYCKR